MRITNARWPQFVRRGAYYEVAMAITQDFYKALASDTPLESLRRAVADKLETGVPREQLVGELEELRLDLRRSGRQEDEDVVLEVMDFLTGFSSPHMRL